MIIAFLIENIGFGYTACAFVGVSILGAVLIGD